MQQTPFHAYYTARQLDTLPDAEKLLPVFASSDIQVYPFQIAAASFALRSPYQKGVILCDEAGMGKSHEAMLIMAQRWMEGQTRILLCIPNADLLVQWTALLDTHYTVPYCVLTKNTDWDPETGFDQSGIVITTYDFAADHEAEASAVAWDLAVYEEANALSGVYQEDNKQAKALYRIAGNAFKVLLTGTPIEKNIMDLYGLIWFIDHTVLPEEKEFLVRYLRKPENYPELAERVSKFCFRTLRSQAQSYAKIPERVLFTYEYTPSSQEQDLYDLLYAYINKSNKLAFPEMETYAFKQIVIGRKNIVNPGDKELFQEISKAMLQTPAVGDRLYKQIPKVVSSLSEIAPKLQEVFDITIQDNNDDDLSLLTGGDVSNSNTANAQIAAAIRQAENPKLVAQTVKSVLDTTEELEKEKKKKSFIFDQVMKAATALTNAVSNLDDSMSKEGIGKQIENIEGALVSLKDWIK